MSTPNQYIQLYSQLQDPKTNHRANQQILKLILKQESWGIAKQLMSMPMQQYHIHGCQILSRKLNYPYTIQMQNKYKICQYILSFNQLNPTLYLCLAKLAIHLGYNSLQFPIPHNNYQISIHILKSLPEISDIITLKTRKDPREHVKLLYNKYKPLLISMFSINSGLAIECCQNYVNNGYKIESQQIMKLILSRPLTQVNQMLENILLTQKYPNLNNQIFEYLIKQSKNNEHSQFFNVFIAFLRSVNILQLPENILNDILSHVLNIMKIQIGSTIEQRNNIAYITDSFQFWQELAGKINSIFVGIINHNNNNNNRMDMDMDQDQNQNQNQIDIKYTIEIQQLSPQIKICIQYYLQLFKIIIERSILYQMPKFQQIKKQHIQLQIIDLDDDHGNGQKIQHSNVLSMNNNFRTIAQDFFSMIFVLISKIQQYKLKSLSIISQLASSSNPLSLQLSIFVLSSIVQNSCQDSNKQISYLINSITGNPHTRDPYIWQKLIQLLGKLGHETICNIQILKSALFILKQAMEIPSLALVACQNFNDILTTCNTSSQKQQQMPLLSQFFQFIYSTIYFQTTNQKIFQVLTKSIFLFIYYFKNNSQILVAYLKQMSTKILAISSLQKQCQIVQNIAICHNFIDSQISVKYTHIISQFIIQFLPIFIKYIESMSHNRENKKISVLLSQLSTLINVSGAYHTQKWIQVIITIQNTTINNANGQKGNAIYLCNKLMDINTYKQSIGMLITKLQPYVTQCLINAQTQQYKLINTSLTFHSLILNKYIQNIQNYNPDNLINFILQKIYKGYLSYEFQSTRTCLNIVRIIISKNYKAQLLLECTLKIYARIVDNLWKFIEVLLIEAYKVGGNQIFKATFQRISPQLAPPNPLFDAFMQGIKNNKMKDFKNLLANLK